MAEPYQILEDIDTTSEAFRVSAGQAFVLMQGYNGGTWKLQIQTPNGDWMDIADTSGGVMFDSDGLQFFYTQSWLKYRLHGGTVGAVAWVIGQSAIG